MDALDWTLARAFCLTAETGSLSAAARKIGATQPTLSRQVAALEASLCLTLFERVGKSLVLTDSGRGLLDAARAMTAAADAFALAAAGRVAASHGRVTISATDMIAAHLLPDIVAKIRRAAPEITIAIVATNALSDLRRREADIAIRHVRPTEPDLIGRKVATAQAHVYAATAWIAANGKPRRLADLRPEDIMAYEPVDRFAADLRTFGFAASADDFRVVSDDAVVLWEMVRNGLGVALMLREVAQSTPGIVRLLPTLPGIPVPLWLVTHRELRTNRRVRLVYDVLAAELARHGRSPRRRSHGSEA